ncbi:hypothetical protein Tco_0470739 [Tanacetum coccineum]
MEEFQLNNLSRLVSTITLSSAVDMYVWSLENSGELSIRDMHLLEFFSPPLQPPFLFRQIYRSVITKSHLSTLNDRTARTAISGGSHCFDGCGLIIHGGGGDCGVANGFDSLLWLNVSEPDFSSVHSTLLGVWHAFGNLVRL